MRHRCEGPSPRELTEGSSVIAARAAIDGSLPPPRAVGRAPTTSVVAPQPWAAVLHRKSLKHQVGRLLHHLLRPPPRWALPPTTDALLRHHRHLPRAPHRRCQPRQRPLPWPLTVIRHLPSSAAMERLIRWVSYPCLPSYRSAAPPSCPRRRCPTVPRRPSPGIRPAAAAPAMAERSLFSPVGCQLSWFGLGQLRPDVNSVIFYFPKV
jgi:hypothetical protein